MNGWERIGIVLAILFGIPAFLIAYSENDSAYRSVYPSATTSSLEGQKFRDALWQDAQDQFPDEFDGCIFSTVEMQAPYSEYSGYSVTCEKNVVHAVSHSILWGLLPGFVFWLIGLSIAWVIAGFKRGRE